MNVLVCIPTITGREHYLHQAIRGYQQRTDANVAISIVTDQPTCGMGWQAAVEQGLRGSYKPDFIHFGNDDIVVAEGWLPPLVEAVEVTALPAPRMEPAGVHMNEDPAVSMAPPIGPMPSRYSYFYADLPENQPQQDWEQVDHGALPFCSLEQWEQIGPFLPIHFGTDKWFYAQAKRLGYRVVARMDSVIFNYAVQIGRDKGDWAEQDLIDFDLVFAYPEYERGDRDPTEPNTLRLTDEGLRMVRNWRRDHFDGPHHWEKT